MLTENYIELANNGISADKLAQIFLKDYFKSDIYCFPINPFQILTDLNILFSFRPFNSYDGIYIPSENEDDVPIVGINLNRNIARQRFTAAHELCHHLKDAQKGFICKPNSKSAIEKYAETFASELLMPTNELKKQVDLRTKNGFINLDGVLEVADYFGVSFQACLNNIAFRLHKIEGNPSSKDLQKMAKNYKPQIKRKEKKMYDTFLYEQLFDAIGNKFDIVPTEFACEKFKTEYVYNDSRMEGVIIELEKAAEIVTDLRINKQESKYCTEINRNIIEVAGLTLAYDYVFKEAETLLSIYDAKKINEELYSTAPCPEFGGLYRSSNATITGASVETVDYMRIPEEMRNLDRSIEKLIDKFDRISYSEYIKEVIKIHHRLTVIHAFGDGNGRTSRAFLNMMLLKRHISPVFFDISNKTEYKNALKIADTTKDFNPLFLVFFKEILRCNSQLSNYEM